MDSENKDSDDLERLRQLPVTSDAIGFSPDAMIACEKCGRANPPGRDACLYCGNAICGASTVVDERFTIRELEAWEKGFNVVLTAGPHADAERVASGISPVVGLDAEALAELLSAAAAVPIARVETEDHVAFIVETLAKLGVSASIISDETLDARTAPVRLRSIAFADDAVALGLFQTNEIVSIRRDELALVVRGTQIEARDLSTEQRNRKVTKTVNETSTSSDEPVIDIYSASSSTGWRIPASGFDFSFLGTEKSLLVAPNMELLVARLQEFAPAIRVVDDYESVRTLLEICWPSETQKDNRGFQGSYFRRKGFARVLTTSNSAQFTKYSRMQWQLLYEKEVHAAD